MYSGWAQIIFQPSFAQERFLFPGSHFPLLSERRPEFPRQWTKNRLPDGLQHGTVLGIPNHPHSDWSGPKAEENPLWSPCPPCPSHHHLRLGYSKWLTILAASTFLIIILPELFNLVSAPRYSTPLKLLLSMASTDWTRDQEPGTTSQFLLLLWTICLWIIILSSWKSTLWGFLTRVPWVLRLSSGKKKKKTCSPWKCHTKSCTDVHLFRGMA